MADRRKIKKTVQIGGRRETDSIIALAQKQEDRITTLENQNVERTRQHDELIARLNPMIEAFNAATKLGKWGTSILVFLSVGVAIVTGLIKIFSHK